MKQTARRLLSWLLTLCMVIGMLPITVLAADDDGNFPLVMNALQEISEHSESEPSDSSAPGDTLSDKEVIRYTVLLLDKSGSMGGTPVQRMREAAIKFCEQVLAANGTNIAVCYGNGSNAQKFKFELAEIVDDKKTIADGTYSIETGVSSEYVLDGGTPGSGTLTFFYKVLNVFGADLKISELGGWVYVPLQTNVFTTMRGFYLDGGYMGIAIMGTILGTIWGFLYALQAIGHKVYVLFYALMISSLFFQSFGDYFFYTFSVTLQYYISSIIMSRGVVLYKSRK